MSQVFRGVLGGEAELGRSARAIRTAAKAGLRPTRRGQDGQIVLGDIIVPVDGKPVKQAIDLFALLAK